ncbi:YkgJ family cysteine cluster protein [Faecalibacterium sp. An122]|uniref:YkgJ family cysteine cluster protein n=1 Tax=Faecalibacterium sp. An122 TaxID=1965551 RepID=UPI000B388F5C|nr:YkgJ family cysteine cluster protein [Faecalibacterium sp. An122]OUQ40026.1 hypothetical protein B5E67_01595 [Faecalibacterium sp. An122]
MRDHEIDLCGAENGGRSPEMPFLERDAAFSFRCAGCGGCCRGREDIVLSGYDLYRLSRRLGLPPKLTARAFCKMYIGTVSHLPVLRLMPVKEEHNNCPFFTENRCAVHEARPLVCALYPLGQEISPAGEVRYYFQATRCGGPVHQANLTDYLEGQGIAQREPLDIRWAQCCMALEQEAPAWEQTLHPVVLRRFQAKLGEALYYRYDLNRPWLEQLEENLAWLKEERTRLEKMQQNIHRKK